MLHDGYIGLYKQSQSKVLTGYFQIDQNFSCLVQGRKFIVRNKSRVLSFMVSSACKAYEWKEAVDSFYAQVPRRLPQPYDAHFPPRTDSGARMYCCGQEYFTALTVGLLQAREEILIASWMVSPDFLLTRPPLPPLRLDHLLRLKAEQGVRIFVLLYKEVSVLVRSLSCHVSLSLSRCFEGGRRGNWE